MAYLTAADVRAAYPNAKGLQDEAKITDTQLDDLIAEFAEIAEEYRGVAYEPRNATEVIIPTCNGGAIGLAHSYVRTVTSVTVNTTLLAATSYKVDGAAGAIIAPFTADVPVTVVYSHGLDEPPLVLLHACREYVRACALADNSNVTRDVIGQTTDGGYTRYSTPDKDAGRPTGYLEVDRLLNSLDDFRPNFA